MRVVVLGATGNVGTSVVRALARDDAVTQIVGVARHVPRQSMDPKLVWESGDVEDVDGLRRVVRGADAVVHLVWLIQPSRDLSRLWRVNAEGSANVLAAVEAEDVPVLVYASSVGAYSPGPADGRAVDESWPTHGIPTSPYSREKAYVERLLDAAEAREPSRRIVRLRPALLFKAEAASRLRRLFLGSLFPNALARPGAVPVLPNVPGLQFQALHTGDVADAFHAGVVRDVRGAFNLAADPVLGLEEIADLLGARTVDVPVRLARTAVRATWAARLHPVDVGWFDLALRTPLLDAGRARRELGWAPRISATEALLEILGGVRRGTGGATPALQPDTWSARPAELATAQGAREIDPPTDTPTG
ncbi:NAD-dependent epimerase/dehydratase family protein [Egicoccus halophilus]|uniref:NAD-dependent epimerase n=1 Tax=Egicoccus halophilus TaxID=1670830 RepID=A0A8J3A8N5_9ACTN|nr:NAD-dependent epimerase/dehydratase family protein [Egicoccus halophilus]GGI04591.1 NAD-dependent epimerase [Egicoccus halophilus]